MYSARSCAWLVAIALTVTFAGRAAAQPAPQVCGNGIVEAPIETCDEGAGVNGTPGSCCSIDCLLKPAGTTCRPSAGQCDAEETCTGLRGDCPNDLPAPNGTACTDGSACTQNDTCQAGTCQSGQPVVCDDQNVCTRDACVEIQGQASCVFTPTGQCPTCGDGNVDPGETCDPPNPAINPVTGQETCRADCTTCGDGQVNGGETCDDGNRLSGCRTDKPAQPIDACQNNCTVPICSDPAMITLTPGIDRLWVHGRLIDDGTAIDFTAQPFVIQLVNASGVVFRAEIPAGAIEQAGARLLRTRSRTARIDGGLGAVKIIGKKGYWRFTLDAYGELSGSTEDMTTQIFAGDRQWSLRGIWKPMPNGWRLDKDSPFLVP